MKLNCTLSFETVWNLQNLDGIFVNAGFIGLVINLVLSSIFFNSTVIVLMFDLRFDRIGRIRKCGFDFIAHLNANIFKYLYF